MKRTFSIPDITMEIFSSIEYSGGKGTSIIVSGKTGYGQSETVDLVEKDLEAEGYRIYRGSSVNDQENLKYAPFNHIMDRLEGRTGVRDLSQIIEAFGALPRDGRSVIIIEGLELSSEPTKYLFNYLCRISRNSNFHIMGTLSLGTGKENSNLARFLKIIRAESLATSLELEKPKVKHFYDITRMKGLNLPYGFVEDSFRLADGNLAILDYVLRYYREKGIINQMGTLDEQVYRFFLIPGSLSGFYSGIIAALGHGDLMLLSILHISQYPMDIETVSSLCNENSGKSEEALGRLISFGLAEKKGDKYSAAGGEIGGLIVDRIDKSLLAEASMLALKSRDFEHLPLQAKLNFYMETGDSASVSGLIYSEWKMFIRKFSSLDELSVFISRARGMDLPHEACRILDLVECNVLFNSGKLREALSLYEEEKFLDIDPVSVRLTTATIYREMGKPGQASEILELLLDEGPLPPEAETLAILTLAESHYDMEEMEKGENLCRRALEMATARGYREFEARIYTVLGNICFYRSSLQEAEENYRRSIAINRELGIWMEITRNMNNLAALEEFSGDYGAAVATLENLLDYTYLTGDATMRAHGRYNLAMIQDLLGEWGSALRQIDAATTLGSIIGNRALALRCREATVMVLMKMMNFEGAVNEGHNDFKVPPGHSQRIIDNLSGMAEYLGAGTRPKQEPLPATDDDGGDPRLMVQYNMALSLYSFLTRQQENAWSALDAAASMASRNGDRFFREIRKAISILSSFFREDYGELQRMLDGPARPAAYLSRAIEKGASLSLSLAKGETDFNGVIALASGQETSGRSIFDAVIRAMVAYCAMTSGTTYSQPAMDMLTEPLSEIRPLKNYLGVTRLSQGR